MQPSVRGAQQLAQALKVAALGAVGVYGVSNSIFNVEGGHRAIIFNRVVGIKDTVRRPRRSAHTIRVLRRLTRTAGVPRGHALDGAMV